MVTLEQNTDVLKEKIRNSLDDFDSDKIRKLYSFVAELAASNAIEMADEDWTKKNMSRKKIADVVDEYRKSKQK